MEKLPIEFKEKWVEALRSGVYKQGREALYNKEKGSYCCLGVACRIVGYEFQGFNGLRGFPGELTVRTPNLPPVLLDDGYDDNSVVRRISRLNDTGHSFSEIADYIEQHL